MIALRHLLPDQPLPERLRDLTINALRLDSRAVTPGDLFLAVPGHNADGRQFIDAAVRAGAAPTGNLVDEHRLGTAELGGPAAAGVHGVAPGLERVTHRLGHPVLDRQRTVPQPS